mgnify:CR=1 FL=1|tara:strand:+ start:621 stop:1037 length:417 start_codon:yes stop_codon:yes gene_type:complete
MHINCLAITSVILLGGCASGATEFTCGEFPEGKCQPVSSSYEASHGALEDYDYREGYDEQVVKPPNSALNTKVNALNPVVTVSNISTSLNHAVSGDPIYSKPVVLRILFNDWEDDNGNLHSRNYVYQVIRESKWLIVN